MRVFRRLITLGGFVLSSCLVAGAMTEIRVTDYGAVPDDGKDDGPAIRAAFAAAKKHERPCVVFPRGKYDLSAGSVSGPNSVEVHDFPEITVRGERAEIVGNGVKTLFLFQGCGRVIVSGLDVDWDVMPFTAGRVIASQGDALDVEIIPPHPLREDTAVQSIMAYTAEGLPIPEADAEGFLLTQKTFSKKAKIVGPNTLRIFISPQPEILRSGTAGRRLPPVGTHVLAWYQVRGGGAFRAVNCGSVEFVDNRVFAAPGMGFATNSCERVTFERCQVAIRPGSGRWMSTTVDATHCNMIRRSVDFRDCLFEGMGDDGANIHGMYSMVHERTGPQTIVARGWQSPFNGPLGKDDLASPARYSLRVGDTLEFSRRENPLEPTFTAKIVEVDGVEVRGFALKRLRLDRVLPDYVEAGGVFGNAAEAPRLRMTNCVVRGNRGCGVRVKTRDAIVENCTFENVLGAGVWVTCDAAVDRESLATRAVTIRNNVFKGAGPAVSVSAGRKEHYPDIHRDLAIVGNRVETASVAFSIRSTKGVVIRDNEIRSTGGNPIRVELSSDVKRENNEIVSLR
jgi:hypothetical protein